MWRVACGVPWCRGDASSPGGTSTSIFTTGAETEADAGDMKIREKGVREAAVVDCKLGYYALLALRSYFSLDTCKW